MEDDFENWLSKREKEPPVDNGELSIGTIVGDYRIVALLGRGGFAEVYRAVSSNNEHVAIKILHRQDEQSRLRFEREAKILSQIHHANTPRLITFGILGSRPYLVMELLRADELPHTGRAVAHLIRKVCAAVTALHKMGYVHRDIKPANILWRGNEPVLIDYGLACPFSDGIVPPSTLSIVDGHRIVVGTAGYAAPEQFAGGKIDASTDIHAIGMLANSCFEGRPPWRWRKIIDRATNSRNNARYKTAKKLARAVSCRNFGIIGWSSLCILLVFLMFPLVAVLYWVWLHMSFSNGGNALPSSYRFDQYCNQEARVMAKALYFPEQMSAIDFDELQYDNCFKLLYRRPELIDYMNTERLLAHGSELGQLVNVYPWIAKHIDLSRLSGWQLSYFLEKCPDLVDMFGKEQLEGCWDKLLPIHPEWSDRCDFKKLTPVEWANLLVKTDRYDNECDFSQLDGWQWCDILRKTDRLDLKCDFRKLDGWTWPHVLKETKRFDGIFNASGFNGRDWASVLACRPDLISVCSNEFTGVDVVLFLEGVPWMTNKCDFSSLTPLNWGALLKDNPQFLSRWNCQGYRDEDWHMFANGYFDFYDGAEPTFLKLKALRLDEVNQMHIRKYIINYSEQDVKVKRLRSTIEFAKKGDKVAMNYLGMWYLGLVHDAPVERNDNVAVMWYMKAVNAGNSESMARLGECYENGYGLETNLVRAVELYKMSADRNCAHGAFQLGECYLNGIGTSTNVSEAVRLFEIAAKAKNTDNMLRRKIHHRLGNCYENGIGVAVDLRQARKWYSEAAREGCEQSRAKVESIDGKLNASSGVKR